ncbi:hypothetical protein [Streptomyces sp. NPDC001070]
MVRLFGGGGEGALGVLVDVGDAVGVRVDVFLVAQTSVLPVAAVQEQ